MHQTTESMGIILRRLRKAAGLSVQQTSHLLKHRFGRRANVTTLYSYENAAHPRMPNAGLFLELCQIYGCTSILETFSDIQFNANVLTETEWDVIRKFRTIDETDQEILLSMLNLFVKRATAEQTDTYDGLQLVADTSEKADENYRGNPTPPTAPDSSETEKRTKNSTGTIAEKQQ